MTEIRLPRWKAITLLLLWLAMTASFVLMARLPHFTRQAPTYLSYFGLAFLLYLAAVALLWRVELTAISPLLIAVFLGALLMRLPLWFTQPSLSTDVWRYLWDGKLLASGVNPYAERVDSPALDPLAQDIRPQVQHQWMASPYPPAAQAAFGAVYSVAPGSPTAMQVTFTLFDLASGVVIIAILRRKKLQTGRSLLYLWNPLIVVEFAHAAHIDSLTTLLMLLAILALLEKRRTASMLALLLSTLTKFIPALLLPAFVRRWGWKRTIAFGFLGAASYLPFLGAGLGLTATSDGTGIFGAARIYSLQWKTNDGLFYWLVEWLRNMGGNQPVDAAKLISTVVLAMVAVWVLLRASPKEDQSADGLITNSTLLISAYLLLSAAVFPWYLAWLIALLPFLPVHRNKAWWPILIGWLYFSAAVNLSYLFYIDPAQPREIQWVRQAEYWPLFAMLSLGALRWIWDQSRQRLHQAGS